MSMICICSHTKFQLMLHWYSIPFNLKYTLLSCNIFILFCFLNHSQLRFYYPLLFLSRMHRIFYCFKIQCAIFPRLLDLWRFFNYWSSNKEQWFSSYFYAYSLTHSFVRILGKLFDQMIFYCVILVTSET